jgi:LmbE family N-acetylglucosaminyl deacetylase
LRPRSYHGIADAMNADHARIQHQAGHSGLHAMWRALQRLRSVSCWMQFGAHPDDEWNGFLAWLAVGHGVRTVFVCALRGEGGQNAIGPETGHDLGVLRSREMTLAAEEIGLGVRWLNDGESDTLADFGFSRTGTDTLARWGEDRLLAGMVRAIRSERPDVVSAAFLDVPGQHGHHRAMTATMWKAVTLAADPGYVLQGSNLPTWSVLKTYLPAFSGASASYDDREPPPPATVTVDLGETCRPLGATWVQIGERSRRFHASQGMGRWMPVGPRSLALHQRSGRPDFDSPLDGLPRRLSDLAELPALRSADAAIDDALAAFPDWDAMADALHAAIGHLRDVDTTGRPALEHRVAIRQRQLAVAAAHALGLPTSLDVPEAPWRAGDTVPVRLPGVTLRPIVPHGWATAALSDGFLLHIPGDAAPFGFNRPGYDPLGGNEPVCVAMAWSHAGVAAEMLVDPPSPIMLAPEHDVAADPEAVAVLPGGRPVIRLTGAEAPEGWPVLGLRTQGDSILLELAPHTGRRLLSADGARLRMFEHAHVGTLGRPVAAEVVVQEMSVLTDPNARVAVLEGATAGLCAWLRQIGIAAEPIDGPDALAAGGFTCVLVGHFGFAQHPALTAGLDRLLAWVRAGGMLVTLYHRPQDRWPGAPLLPIEIGVPSFRWRVTLPDAPLRLLQPAHPLLSWPNRLEPADWDGWVRERGLYFGASWAPAYHPLVATGDPGEPELLGGLLVRELGRGRHVHVALALHHQLAALVPGAFRLLANLVAGQR